MVCGSMQEQEKPYLFESCVRQLQNVNHADYFAGIIHHRKIQIVAIYPRLMSDLVVFGNV
jgi:hypothetical protein